ncbi:hypothetical protein PspLS_12184 [Pyricularia sp. CBS 133598]|nr:hypothetical protein PspLS_12184 [Pyricularia sp. CBS 133598]
MHFHFIAGLFTLIANASVVETSNRKLVPRVSGQIIAKTTVLAHMSEAAQFIKRPTLFATMDV